MTGQRPGKAPKPTRKRQARPATVEIGIAPGLVEELRILTEARTKSEAVRRAVVDALSRARATASVAARARAASAARAGA